MLSYVLLSDRMVINYAVKAIETVLVVWVVLEVDPVLHSAQVVPQVDEACGLDAREDNLLRQLVH